MSAVPAAEITGRKAGRSASDQFGITTGPKSLITRAEAANLLGISTRTLERYDRDGTGPGFHRIGPRLIRYSPDACRAWAASRCFPHRAAELARASAQNETTG
ncbi:helix-turn-helix transcriptional regulator [Enterovirga sp. CN4-39]|uniref:helix-turn-helix transcriptional regulator n=1 Tax=Enterovirga sp. CN4-39 TaxID=3400910 RepID=UPI003C102BCE